VSDAGCSSGTLRQRRKIPLLFGEKSLKTVCFDASIFKNASELVLAYNSDFSHIRERSSRNRDGLIVFPFEKAASPRQVFPLQASAHALLIGFLTPEKGISGSQKEDNEFMRKFLLGLVAVLAMLLPISQRAQARWAYYHHYWGYQHVCVQGHGWHDGYC
jgi:hypothetical protein